MERKRERQLICGKRKCRSALHRAEIPRGYLPSPCVFSPLENPIKPGSKTALKPDRATLIRNAKQVEFFGGGRWREVVSPDGVRCYVNRLWGKAA